ncbi:MAG: hypothetical protein ACJZ8Y_10320 [Pirellulaceae bacterium]
MKYFITIATLFAAFLDLQGTEEFLASRTDNVTADNPLTQEVRLRSGDTFETTVRLVSPSTLFPNARLRVTFELVSAADDSRTPRGQDVDQASTRKADIYGIYTNPTSNWSKVIHSHDPDVYVNYRAPISGLYRLTIVAAQDELARNSTTRWREPGNVRNTDGPPRTVPWPANVSVPVSYHLTNLPVPYELGTGTGIELEPNDTPELAQPIMINAAGSDQRFSILGSADDIEYFDNGDFGRSGDDWYRIDFNGTASRLLTACLSIPDQQVAAQIRVYRVPPEEVAKGHAVYVPGRLIPIEEYTMGRNENERNHQQAEQHRIAVNRTLIPGETYFLRVEANSPAYDLEVRCVQPAPYKDPRQAIRHGLYDHIGQVDAWLTNRPRGASVDRRIRDTGNLLGTNCMSCHTQSGVWGPAVPFENGYRPQNVQLWRHLINTCYQSLRPTNALKDAANNTSLAPLDLGDGPAGTRVAGHALVALERAMPPRQLQSKQQLRTANFILQSADPGGINAAGPGANVGQGVVYNYTGEILANAWEKQKEVRFFRALEEKANKMLGINVKYVDDLGHRIEFYKRYFPADYVAQATELANHETEPEQRSNLISKARELQDKIDAQVQNDLDRLFQTQLDDGGWGFNPGSLQEGKWQTPDGTISDPSPTSTSLLAFHAAGLPADHSVVKATIDNLLRNQKPTGMWKLASQTGFVSTSYALNALARYFPEDKYQNVADDIEIPEDATVEEIVTSLRRIYIDATPETAKLAASYTSHPLSVVRYYATLSLGAVHNHAYVDTLIDLLADRSKQVREAAHWAMRQTLIDDHGWTSILLAAKKGDDFTRESAMRALIMLVDSEMPTSSLNHAALTATLDHALNDDPHPAVRSWATRSAWQWWVWNPVTRGELNKSWIRLLSRPETEALTELAMRYQSHALFVVNGHIANGSRDHQYKELANLFVDLHSLRAEFKKTDQQAYARLTERLVAIASTFHKQRGGDGGPGQLGYTTTFADDLFGNAVIDRLATLQETNADDYGPQFLATLEGSANIPNEELQQILVDLSINGPEHIRPLASESISDPRLVSLIAVPEQLEPMLAQLWRGAMDPPRRKELSEPILKMIAKVRWIIPQSEEQKDELLQFLVPNLDGYLTDEQITALQDDAERAEAVKLRDAIWYVADRLGQAVAENPDLHFENLVNAFPQSIENNAQARYWMQSVPWMLEYKTKLPEVDNDPNALPPVDPYEELRTRALMVFLQQLSTNADPRTRKLAVDLANQTSMKRNPEILVGLEALQDFETDKKVLENANKVLSQSQGAFKTSLLTAVSKEPDHGFEEEDGMARLPDDFFNDVVYFRDYVMPEMTKVLRGDERSCMICHGEPGRVPSLELYPPDQVGFLSVDQLLINYRILQHRVNTADIMNSKLIRKPLNVQTGKEDGHQGGRRYQPNDPGYLILKQWVENQVNIQGAYGLPERNKK